MGRLAGFRYKEVVAKLAKLGCVFVKHSKGSHELWYNTQKSLYSSVPNHGGKDIKEGTLRAILRQLGISVEDFLDVK